MNPGAQKHQKYAATETETTNIPIKAWPQPKPRPAEAVWEQLSKRGCPQTPPPPPGHPCVRTAGISPTQRQMRKAGRAGTGGAVSVGKPVKLLPPWHLAAHQRAGREPAGYRLQSVEKLPESTTLLLPPPPPLDLRPDEPHAFRAAGSKRRGALGSR